MATAEDLARAILAVYEPGASDKITKGVLVYQRLRVLELCATVLGWKDWAEPELAPIEHLDAYRIIFSYEGQNRFMRGLRQWVEAGNLLTDRQIDALMGPVPIEEADIIANHGQTVPEHAWQAREMINAIRREAVAQARVAGL